MNETERLEHFAAVTYGIGSLLTKTAPHVRWSSAEVRQAFVLPLLQAAGFNIWNPFEVAPDVENTAGGRKVQFVIRVGPTDAFVLQAQPLNAELFAYDSDHTFQYARDHRVRWVVLTNGIVWAFFDLSTLNMTALTRQPTAIIELSLAPDSEGSAARLYALLARSVWAKTDSNRFLQPSASSPHSLV
jgi:predicted type IV restriction endonuclease